jgi:hypothetical protein
MTKTKKYVLAAICAVALIAALPFLVIFPFAASNAGTAIMEMVFDRKPADTELYGTYAYQAEWGTATLELHSDKTFVEKINQTGQQPLEIKGNWNSTDGDEGFAAELNMKPFIAVDDFSKGSQFDFGSMNFYKQRLGTVYGEINPDTGQRFLKQ